MTIRQPSRPKLAVPAEYLPLHKYLTERYSDTVVLKLGEIEDLLGASLPPDAHRIAGWWDTADAIDQQSLQSRAWTQADRSATLNDRARTVVFDRLPD
jgi:hypothetical protein